MNKVIETSDFTVAYLTIYSHNGDPVYDDDENYWAVNPEGYIELIDKDDVDKQKWEHTLTGEITEKPKHNCWGAELNEA